MAVLTAVRGALGRAGLLGRDVLVGLSGGLDSICLARLLAAIAKEDGGRLEVAHVDHGLRADSRADARFCRETAEELGLPFHLRVLAPEAFGKGESLQAEARRLRRAFFEETTVARGLDAVALGHHADDQAETVLLKLIRGAGPRGVAGMKAWSPPYARPLLEVRRATLEALARQRGWAFREDPSNRSARYLRNRVRLEVLPLLRTLNPDVEAALARLARLSAEDDACLSGEACAALEALGRPEPEGLRLPVDGLQRLTPPVRRRLWLAACGAVGGDPAALEARHLEAVEGLLREGRPQRRAPVPGPALFARCWGDAWVLRPDSAVAVVDPVGLPVPGRASLGVFGLEAVSGPFAGRGPSVALPPGRPEGELVLRPRCSGDRLGRTKVKDLLMEARLPAWRRARTLVVEDRAGVLGLLGPGFAAGLPEGGRNPPEVAVWLEESGEKRWCP